MAWISIAIDVDAARADALADALLGHGACSVDVSDAQAGGCDERPIFDEPGESSSSWTIHRVSALFDGTVDYCERVRAACADAGVDDEPAITACPVAERDWVRATQQQFEPLCISERLWIVPSWSEPPAPQAINLRLDPGLAFGTGSHPTTWQCLRWLEHNISGGQSVLDYGCGSGILAIAAKHLGAELVIGVDVDHAALRTSRENARTNAAEVQFLLPEALPELMFDVVVANILANPLRMLAPLLAARTRPGGSMVLAGILSAQADALRLAYAPWCDLERWTERDGWICMSGVRRG
jgi:ribosomal protein L11 methyltransferase